MVMNPLSVGPNTRVVTVGLADVLQSIKDAEAAAETKIESSKEKASKIVADARKSSLEIVQKAQDGAVSSTSATLDTARGKAGKEAEGVQAEGTKAVGDIQSSAGDRRAAAVQILIDSMMPN
jgi:ATP synthase H subunit